MSKRNNELLVADMLEAAERIQAYTDGLNFEKFMHD